MTRKPARATRPEEPVETLVREHRHIVYDVARQVKARVGNLYELEELQAVGQTALFLAARDHDPQLSPFSAYAQKRIRWAMIDAVRRETHVRAVRGTQALRHVPFEDPETEDGHTVRRSRGARDAVRDPTLSPEELVGELGDNLDLLGAMTELDRRDRLVLERHYFHGEALDDIARSIALSKSWMSRIHARALDRLGNKLLPMVERAPEASCDSKKASSSLPVQHKVSGVTSPRVSPKPGRRSRRGT